MERVALVECDVRIMEESGSEEEVEMGCAINKHKYYNDVDENVDSDNQDGNSSHKGHDDCDSGVKPIRPIKRKSTQINSNLCKDMDGRNFSDDSEGDNDDIWHSSTRRKKHPKKRILAAERALKKTLTPSKPVIELKLPNSSNNVKVVAKVCIRPSGPDGTYSDDLLHCVECSRAYVGDCPEHGPLLIIEDISVPANIDDKFRARKTTPPQVSVADSKIPEAGSGVWARQVILPRTRFGPYDGRKVSPDTSSPYAWLIRKNGQPDHCVDASEPGLSNWMRYVNCARHDGEQNLHAFQYKGKLYYRTIRRVVPDEELLIWYGDEYGRQLGIDPARRCSRNCSALSKDLKIERNVVKIESTTNHIQSEAQSSDQPFYCSQCSELLPDETSWNLHIKSHKKKKYACTMCDKRFALKRSLNIHLRHHSGEKPFVCHICSKSFIQKPHLDNHMITHSGERPFICEICEKGFSRRGTLRIHVRLHIGDKPFACTECDKRFSEKTALNIHLRMHSGERPFVCKECNKGFCTVTLLNVHQRIHTGYRPFACHECGKRFSSSGNLSTHMKTHSDEKPFVCPECDQRFARKSNLKAHLRCHNKERPFSCNECEKKFTKLTHLKDHERSHSGEKPFVCPVCSKGFNRRENMKNHVRIHSGERLFACKACSKQFTCSANLVNHMRTHSGQKPYACSECDKRFTEKGSLKVHQRIHSGEKPFLCPACKERFLYRDTWIQHLKSHQAGSDFACCVCNEEFEQTDSLEKHLLTHNHETDHTYIDCHTIKTELVEASEELVRLVEPSGDAD